MENTSREQWGTLLEEFYEQRLKHVLDRLRDLSPGDLQKVIAESERLMREQSKNY